MAKSKTCEFCGQGFECEVKCGTPRRYCSDLCQRRSAYARRCESGLQNRERACSRCGVAKPASEFSSGTHAYCRPCHAAYARARRVAVPELIVEYRRTGTLRRYGLTIAEFDALVAKQDGKCAICGTDDPGGNGVWHVDHDHSCCTGRKISCGRCVRGLLCNRCNIGLGNFKDNPDVLRAAVSYLESFRQS